MSCPDYYLLADTDGRQFWEFYRDECAPIVADKLNDGEKHALQSACEHLFRRGLKGDEADDLTKYRWWLYTLLNGFQSDDSSDEFDEHRQKLKAAILPVIALVELRRNQKLGTWAELAHADSSKRVELDAIRTAWGNVSVIDGEAS